MFSPTTMATSGSRTATPVARTSSTPTTTPNDVHTSVIRCWPSASRMIDPCCPAGPQQDPADDEVDDASPRAASAAPTPSDSSGCGASSRDAANPAMPRPGDAARAALPCRWRSTRSSRARRCGSGRRGGRRTRGRSTPCTAARRLTPDSRASAKRPDRPGERRRPWPACRWSTTAAAADSRIGPPEVGGEHARHCRIGQGARKVARCQGDDGGRRSSACHPVTLSFFISGSPSAPPSRFSAVLMWSGSVSCSITWRYSSIALPPLVQVACRRAPRPASGRPSGRPCSHWNDRS